MPDVSPGRIAAIAAAARIPIEPGTPERVAGAVSMPVNRLSEANLVLPMEVEPSTFMAVQQKEIRR